MTRQDHILAVDDDIEIRTLLRQYLERHGYRVTAAADGKQMRAAMAQFQFDLIILDLMLPGEDGLVLCRDVRAISNVPIIMLTAHGDEADRIVGLEMGADDYLPKPFNPRELLARIRSVLRRARSLRNLLSPTGVVIPISSTEFRLISIFLEHANRVLNRDQLIDLMQSRDASPFDRAVDVQVSRLRHRLGDDAREPTMIKTVRGQGYVFAAQVEAVSR
jgi:two-component system OmpR family response regulator